MYLHVTGILGKESQVKSQDPGYGMGGVYFGTGRVV